MDKKIIVEFLEKMSDDVLFIGSATMLRFNVVLGHKREDGSREPFHKEFGYTSTKYQTPMTLYTIRRSFDYFLSIESGKGYSRDFIMIRPQDMYALMNALNQVTQWFNDDSIFVLRNNTLQILKNVTPIRVGLGLKYIEFEPVVVSYSNDEQSTGVRMYISNSTSYIDIDINRFYGLKYTIDTFNMYSSAQMLLNYVGRPEFGTNQYIFDDSETVPTEKADIKTTRKIPIKKRSFFDSIDTMISS